MYKKILNAIESGDSVSMISTYENGNISKALVDENFTHSELSYTVENEKIKLVEHYLPKPRLIILGGGHIAVPLCLFAEKLDFSVVICDDRPYFANTSRFPDAYQVVCDRFEKAILDLNLRANDYVVIVTRGHRHDQACLQTIINNDVFPCYVGMIGSKRRAKIVLEQVTGETNLEERISKIHTPIGLSIGAITPDEIALSIMAEIVQERRKCNDTPKKQVFESQLDIEIIKWLISNEDEKAILVTILSADGSTPRSTGAKMLITAYGQTIGSIGGGCAEADVIEKARTMIEDCSYGLINVDLSDSAEEDGMVCGGKMVVLFEEVYNKKFM